MPRSDCASAQSDLGLRCARGHGYLFLPCAVQSMVGNMRKTQYVHAVIFADL